MRHIGSALAIAVIGAALVALQIAFKGEIWIERTILVVALTALGGFAGSLATVISLSLLLKLTRRASARAAAAFLFAGFFMLVMGGAYVVLTLVVAGEFEPDRNLRLMSWLASITQVFGLFLISSPAYLLPLPLPVMMLAAARLLRSAPRRHE